MQTPKYKTPQMTLIYFFFASVHDKAQLNTWYILSEIKLSKEFD